jgi:hypothetical protein
MRITVNIPSLKRPNGVRTLKYVPSAQVWVCETEVESYKKGNPGAVIRALPPAVRGNIARVRNYILDSEDQAGVDAVCMIDDDFGGIQYFEKRKRRRLVSEDVIPWIEQTTALAEEWGVKLWGINCNNDGQSYREYTPFSTLSYISATFCVHIRSDLRYDERLPLKEDYDLILQHLNKYRGVLRLNKFYFSAKQAGSGGGQPGGCAEYRNMKREQEQFDLLVKKWGGKIVKQDQAERSHQMTKTKRGERDINPVVKAPIRGV